MKRRKERRWANRWVSVTSGVVCAERCQLLTIRLRQASDWGSSRILPGGYMSPGITATRKYFRTGGRSWKRLPATGQGDPFRTITLIIRLNRLWSGLVADLQADAMPNDRRHYSAAGHCQCFYRQVRRLVIFWYTSRIILMYPNTFKSQVSLHWTTGDSSRIAD